MSVIRIRTIHICDINMDVQYKHFSPACVKADGYLEMFSTFYPANSFGILFAACLDKHLLLGWIKVRGTPNREFSV